jgi:hypothetical protein
VRGEVAVTKVIVTTVLASSLPKDSGSFPTHIFDDQSSGANATLPGPKGTDPAPGLSVGSPATVDGTCQSRAARVIVINPCEWF